MLKLIILVRGFADDICAVDSDLPVSLLRAAARAEISEKIPTVASSAARGNSL